ncbi:hypothetical protein QUF50_01070 [Thiotrichales bacterium HSG1]|nr:hypothetical protein [Thiotrichales bacterium HSG1]
MVNFSVFNEKSLPFTSDIDIEKKFIDFFKLLEQLNSKHLKKVRMDKDFKSYPILKDVSLQQFFGKLRNNEFKDRLREFINNGIIKIESPIIKIDENEEKNKFLENEYFYKEKSTKGGLACCDIWDTLAISFNSDGQWNREKIILQKQTVFDEEKIINIRHSSKIEHLNTHQDFFQELEKYKKLGITQDNLWERKKKLFPKKIIFCEEVEEQIKSLNTIIFQQAITILRNVESGQKLITDYNYTPEGESVRNSGKLKKLRYFTINGEKVYFDNHIKSLPNGNRIYFLEKDDKVYIGYIGKHLKTKKYK